MFQFRIARRDVDRRLVEVDSRSLLRRVLLRDQFTGREPTERGIGVELRSVGERELLRFRKQMDVLGTLRPHRLQVEAFQDVEHLQRGDPLSIGRQLPHGVPAIRGRDRIEPVALVFGEVTQAEVSAILFAERHDLVRDASLVEDISPLGSDRAIGLREFGERHDLTDLRRPPVLQVDPL